MLGPALGARSVGRAGGVGVDAKGFARVLSLCAAALAHIMSAMPDAMQSEKDKRLAFEFSFESVIERTNSIPLREPWQSNKTADEGAASPSCDVFAYPGLDRICETLA